LRPAVGSRHDDSTERDAQSPTCRRTVGASLDDPWTSVAVGSSYQIEVLAAGIGDLVSSAGGWLFDRMTAGWVVNVLLLEDADTRPLQILGLRAIFCDSAQVRRMPSRAMLAAAADVDADGRLRRSVARALQGGLSEVTLWGSAAPRRLAHKAQPVRYRMSTAARVFKGQALLAASVPHPSESATETFLDYAGWCGSGGSDSLRLGRAAVTQPMHPAQRIPNGGVRPKFGR
jgi:hypothetical protein